MSITVQGHQHDPAVVFEGSGTAAPQIVIQTGTVVFNFSGSPDEGDWVRDRLVLTVLELPAVSLLFNAQVVATASAAPASMTYMPPPVVRIRQSPIGAVFSDDTSHDPVPVPPISVLGAGWAVDRTEARHAGNKIQLVVDLAVLGHSSVMRLAYSVFVTVTPQATTHP
jgi:hypothetical protein